MEVPKITIITVCYNNIMTIEDTLRSIASQSYPSVEHIVIDGNSSDGTVDILKAWNGHKIRLVSEPDRGIYDAMNKGLKLVTGEVIGFLNADDIYANENVLDEVAKVFSDPAVEACYADLIYVDPVNVNKIVRFWRSRPYEEGLFKKGWVPAHPTFFVRKNVYEKYGRFDLGFKLAADYELMLRFLEKGRVNSVYIPKVLVKMRLGGATNKNIANIIKQNIEIQHAGKKNNVKISPVSFLVHKILTRISQFIVRPTSDV